MSNIGKAWYFFHPILIYVPGAAHILFGLSIHRIPNLKQNVEKYTKLHYAIGTAALVLIPAIEYFVRPRFFLEFTIASMCFVVLPLLVLGFLFGKLANHVDGSKLLSGLYTLVGSGIVLWLCLAFFPY